MTSSQHVIACSFSLAVVHHFQHVIPPAYSVGLSYFTNIVHFKFSLLHLI